MPEEFPPLYCDELDFLEQQCAKCKKTGSCKKSRAELSNCMESKRSHEKSVARDLLLAMKAEMSKVNAELEKEHENDPAPITLDDIYKHPRSCLTECERLMNDNARQSWNENFGGRRP